MENQTWMIEEEDIYWNNSVKRYYCPACRTRPIFDRETGKFILTNFCGNCGADLRGKNE